MIGSPTSTGPFNPGVAEFGFDDFDFPGTLAELDVTGVVTGPGPIDFYLTTLGDDTTEYASRDAGAGAPVLIVRWGG